MATYYLHNERGDENIIGYEELFSKVKTLTNRLIHKGLNVRENCCYYAFYLI